MLHQSEIAQDSRILSVEESWLCSNLKKHSLALSSLLRTIARSRSRITWLSEGDANTALFHAQARNHKQRNFIAKLVENDQVLTCHYDNEKTGHNFYNNLLGMCVDHKHTINPDELNINSHDLAALKTPISEEEVWKTICHLPSDKALGPDGLTGRNCVGPLSSWMLRQPSQQCGAENSTI
jgi:hypothetical protein